MWGPVFFLLPLTLLATVNAWDSEQLEVFDVVEEVKENFYEMFNISTNATSSEIRTSFKRLSLVWHPDKNKNEDTSEKFRNLVSVYEVLKDQKKRAYYDEVLVNGLPNWKSAMYYYRRVRKMGLLEGALIIFGIITIGQYLVAWATYYERLYTIEQQMKPKKSKKNAQKSAPNPPPIIEINKPSLLNTLPIQIPCLIFYLITSIPTFLIFCKDLIMEKLQPVEEPESSDEEELTHEKKTKRRKAIDIPEGPTFEVKETLTGSAFEVKKTAPVSGGLWTDDDLDDLVQLMKKYPGGTADRWEVISEAMGRSVPDVTFMANKLKNKLVNYRPSSQDEQPVVEEKVKQKTKGGKTVDESTWSQTQQKALEDALLKFPKGAGERWDRIAAAVSGKTKEECMLRYKHLAMTIQKQKKDA